MRWFWRYKMNLEPKRLSFAPSVGSCGHAAMAAFLQGKDWRKAAEQWAEDQIKKATDAEMFNEPSSFLDMADLIIQVMDRWTAQDPFKGLTFLHVEKKFSIPVCGLKVKLIGFWDAIAQDEDGDLWLVEHKFPQKTFRSEEDLEMDGQIGTYQWAALRSGIHIRGTLFNQILARIPAKPEVNKNGTLSRTKVYTDWETYKAAVVEAGQDPLDYMDMQAKLADVKFVQRDAIFRDDAEVRAFARDFERGVWDIPSARHFYMCESRVNCQSCSFRELCVERLKGDISWHVENLYQPRTRREGVPEGEEVMNHGASA
jgi:hypothetical protein